jgi:tetratricopeptide (TPR) repeat protein
MDFYLVLDCKPTRQALKLRTLIAYVHRHPQGWKRRIQLARLLYTMGHWQEALEQYHRALERQPRSIEAWLEVAEILRLLERGEKAVAAYEQALSFASSPSIRCQVAGLVEACSNRLESAAMKFEAAGWADASAAACWQTLGVISLRLERPAQALEAFEKALAANPDDVAALTYSHDALAMIGRPREGLRRVMRAIELSPDNALALKKVADYRCRIGLVHGEEGKITKNMIRQALLLAPDAADHHESRALFHIWRGEWKRGIDVLASYTQGHPKNPSGWYHLARSLFRTGEFQAAARAITAAYALYDRDVHINRALCEILPLASRLESLWLILLGMPERYPNQWSILIAVGRTMARWFKEPGLACAISSQAPTLQPRLARAWFGHGRVLALSGRHEEAIVALEQGWQWLPAGEGYDQSTPAAAWLAESYLALGEQSKNRFWCERTAYHANELTALSPSNGHYWEARALESLGDLPGGLRAYRAALNENLLYPERQTAQFAVDQLEALT